MQLPNYFLADLPEGATHIPQLITEACQTLKRNRERFLAGRTTESLIGVLAGLAREWLDPEFPIRKLTLEQGPEKSGFTREVLSHGLDAFFHQITRENLEAMVLQDLGAARRLDEFVSSEIELKQQRAALARGPELLVQITGGILPNPALWSMMLGLLARSAQFIKCASGTSFLP